MTNPRAAGAQSPASTGRRPVLVTGASSGIGLACARAFLRGGEPVAAQYRSLAAPVAALRGEFGAEAVTPIQADLGDEAGCIETVRAAGVPRVLVHSAGIWNEGSIEAMGRERLESMFRLNTFAAYYLTREMLRARRQAGETGAGSVVLIGSTAGQRGEPCHSHYAGSKAALWGLVQSLAQELAPAIRVNLISPGWVRTPMAEATLAEPGREERITRGVPLARIAEPEDIAAAAVFLADERSARHITGVDLSLSGGALLPMPRG